MISKSKYFLIIILFLGITGGLLFFPVMMDNGYTCYYHRFIDTKRPVEEKMVYDGQTDGHVQINHSSAAGTMEHHGSEMLDRYLASYALLWWGSLALLVLSLFALKRYKNNLKMTREDGIDA